MSQFARIGIRDIDSPYPVTAPRRTGVQLVIPPGITPLNFTIIAGESLPLRLTVTKDGNGDALSDLTDYEVVIETRNSSDEAVVVSKSTSDDSVKITGNAADWDWGQAETLLFEPMTAFYVRLKNAEDDSVVALGLINTLRP